MTLRLASYNIRKCLGTDRRRDPHRILQVLRQADADVVALQEVDMRLGPRPAALPRALVEAETDYAPLALVTSKSSLGWHGQTILLRRGLRILSEARVPLPGLEPRGAVLVEVEDPGRGPIRVVGVHLGLLRRDRLRQIRAILSALRARGPMPAAIMGDFNEWSEARGLQGFEPPWEVHTPGPSFHARRPMLALDRIVLGPGLALQRSGVVATALSRRASDHLPIWAEVTRTG
ncbi:endonuclease/exonuclease/phosphatase family protein [Oceanicola granulosus HTCC2516]|uniref:Endonuclease/exonuclease/phosphatase family protein n=1 Tax=Oceanicola granulosus (strain ATCC BAA-861 / DSM 15982 / KCTC 12143 / HTCC2516) TaxID=314256 RepID=Q2C9N7_OCEGH|nr:endonuclease/exonuclease/phosphatase family protein [Oceanicola granulosus]EAR49387.1 endonuclease/exonuclease/phosphatase family protein [Oceanicola granulosus HTCC2516]